jgi:diguanylate cyclase (GGDEF)-like protein/PAS domain S-box-containing protein
MDYEKLSKVELINIIEELQLLNQELLEESERQAGLDFAWTGNLGHWYWNVKTNTVTFNQLKIKALGYSMEELPDKTGYQFFTDKIHPEDYKKTMTAMLDHLSGKSPVYEVEYRIQTKAGDYKWFYDRGRITKYESSGKPVFLAGIVFDITEKKHKQEKLEKENDTLVEKSSTDELTKTKNYRALINLLNEELTYAMCSREPLSLAIFDIDDFKKINDSRGHLFGNDVLVEVADIITKGIRTTDLLGRFGGEEFMIILPKTKLEEALIVAERVREAVESHAFNDGAKITISGGLKEFHGEEMAEFIKSVDANLYKAKRNGKNQVVT